MLMCISLPLLFSGVVYYADFADQTCRSACDNG